MSGGITNPTKEWTMTYITQPTATPPHNLILLTGATSPIIRPKRNRCLLSGLTSTYHMTWARDQSWPIGPEDKPAAASRKGFCSVNNALHLHWLLSPGLLELWPIAPLFSTSTNSFSSTFKTCRTALTPFSKSSLPCLLAIFSQPPRRLPPLSSSFKSQHSSQHEPLRAFIR